MDLSLLRCYAGMLFIGYYNSMVVITLWLIQSILWNVNTNVQISSGDQKLK